MKPAKSGISRDEKGRFPKGVSGNPAGKPEGTVSIVSKIKQKFLEDPEYFDEWISNLMEDPANRRAIMEQIDGKPKQTIAGDSENPITFKLIRYDGDSDSI